MNKIVTCPSCQKQYRLDIAKLVMSRIPGTHKIGAQLSCANCQEKWWVAKNELMAEKKNHKTENFVDKTNFSGLFRKAGEGEKSLSLSNSLQPEIRAEGVYPASKLKKKGMSALTVIALGALMFVVIVGAGLIAMKPDILNFNQLFKKPTAANKPNKNNKKEKLFQLTNVNMKVLPYNEKQNRISIAGDIVNTQDQSIKTTPLNITLVGTCQEGQKPVDGKNCVIKNWQYTPKQEEIPAKQIISFTSASRVNIDLHVEKVYVH